MRGFFYAITSAIIGGSCDFKWSSSPSDTYCFSVLKKAATIFLACSSPAKSVPDEGYQVH